MRLTEKWNKRTHASRPQNHGWSRLRAIRTRPETSRSFQGAVFSFATRTVKRRTSTHSASTTASRSVRTSLFCTGTRTALSGSISIDHQYDTVIHSFYYFHVGYQWWLDPCLSFRVSNPPGSSMSDKNHQRVNTYTNWKGFLYTSCLSWPPRGPLITMYFKQEVMGWWYCWHHSIESTPFCW